MQVYINCIGNDEEYPYQGGLIAVAANSVEECIKTVLADSYWHIYYNKSKDKVSSDYFRNNNWKLQEKLVANVDTPQVLFGDIHEG